MVSVEDNIAANARDLDHELAWFSRVLDERLRTHFQTDAPGADAKDLEPPALGDSASGYATFVTGHRLGADERLALLLSLVPHVQPRLLDVFFLRNKTFDRPFTEFGGEVIGGAFQPTGETLAFILAGTDLARRIASTQFLLDPDHPLTREGVLSLAASRENQESAPVLQRRICLHQEYVIRFTTGATFRPRFGADFPAKLISTVLKWDDLVIDNHTRTQLDEVRRWIEHQATVRDAWGLGKHLRPGYRSLFYGPPGGGKTLAACLLGRRTSREVYRIDLSQMVSKWIGETEKNLARLFDLAQHKEWILFFDEADSLFGKRSETKDAHDRYANQEVSYLLQRIESYDGIAILATNLKTNVDAAFLRRFESVIHFPMPGPSERLRLWQQSLPAPAHCRLEDNIRLEEIAQRYSLTGASIINVMRDACLLALDEAPAANGTAKAPPSTLTWRHLQTALQKEYRKEERAM
ncbi:MAG TPA: ATP-binding protein [Verrucomicrobiota bacterium]|nr:AAA family ATPase [Verrucomicrobiales bacterium]HRI12560.1 ATP-binding protein [Verrucomicrobiota bacterium]